MGLKALIVLALLAAAFFAGSRIARRHWEDAIREAQEAAELARQQEALAIQELRRERSILRGPPPPILPDRDLPQRTPPLDSPP